MATIAPDLKPEEFALIRDFIRERTGIFFHENKSYFIQNRLVDRLTQLGCSSFMDYYYLLKYDPSQEEMEQLVDLITTRETSFFRNPPQLAAFQGKLLPDLLERTQRSGQRVLRLWTAGGASGEEPYPLGVILCVSVPFPALWDLQIVANDISRTALTQARRGIYPRETLKSLDPRWLQKYFLPVSSTYHVRDEVKRLVHFSHLNLSDDRRMMLLKSVD